MRGNVISYFEMCRIEGSSLQRGMNFRLRGGHSVILMSLHPNAPYQDSIEEDGTVLIYEGHDEARSEQTKNPKSFDQPEFLPSGKLSDNGKFHRAAREYLAGKKPPDIVRVYEKIKKGIWSDNGYFHLVDSWQESDGGRTVFKFKLVAVDNVPSDGWFENARAKEAKRSRIIPSAIKLTVWQRDGGRCVLCGAKDELHFDHIVPYAKGGTSPDAENMQLLCMRHNLEKSARIQ